ncbi:unnamed protein product [Amoebophrya sp. A120]|nr:unnamed protein product [Amoebophrya sp. A120]|eukprot:GSA120T00005114001.1
MQKLQQPSIAGGFTPRPLSGLLSGGSSQPSSFRKPLEIHPIQLHPQGGMQVPKSQNLLFNTSQTHGAHALRTSLLGKGSAVSATAVDHAKNDPELANLRALKQNCLLQTIPVKDALDSLRGKQIDGRLDLGAFTMGYQELCAKENLTCPSQDVITGLFQLFDKDKNNVIDPMELCCGLSMMCKGTEDEKIHAVFDCFDEDGNGNISLDEMFKFLVSVYRVVLTPTVLATIKNLGVEVQSPEDLASVTALECFKSADLDGNGSLNVEEFKQWFYGGAAGAGVPSPTTSSPSVFAGPLKKLLH